MPCPARTNADGAPDRTAWFAALFVLLLAAIAHAPALDGGFVFDDLPSIVDNPAIHADDWWRAAFGDRPTPLTGRPVVALTLVANHLTSGLLPSGYHAFNFALHLLNALLLFGVVRRSLRTPNLAAAWPGPRATWTAAALAAIWACHPLTTDAVAYVTQRTTLLMSCWLLAALYGLLRGAVSPRRYRWDLAVVAVTALGMASKQEFVAAPLLLVLFERAFLLPSWAALRERRGFYVCVAATWLVLSACAAYSRVNPTVGYHTITGTTAWQWLLTQATVLVFYLRLSVWPTPLRGVYDWPIVRELGPAVAPGLVLLALLGLSVWLFQRRPWWGWLGAMFFLLLAPTSSVLPIITEIAAERRMYLPMLAVVVPLVLGASQGVAALALRARLTGLGLGAGLASVVIAAAILGTRAHARVFRDETSFWTDAYAKNELRNRSLVAGLILSNYGVELRAQGRVAQANELFERSIDCEAPSELVRLNYAVSLVYQQRRGEAERVLRGLLQDYPDMAAAAGTLAMLLLDLSEADFREGKAGTTDPRLQEAERLARYAVAGISDEPWFYNTLGLVLARQNRPLEAKEALRRAITLAPHMVPAYQNLAGVLLQSQRPDKAIAIWQQLLRAMPGDVGLRMNIVAAQLQKNDLAAATAMLTDVLRLDPGHGQARMVLEDLQRRQGR